MSGMKIRMEWKVVIIVDLNIKSSIMLNLLLVGS